MIEERDVPPAQGILRPATLKDASIVAQLHASAINEGFLTTLGTRFLRRLYARIIKSPHGFLIVADGSADSGMSQDPTATEVRQVVGFVAGATSVRRLYRQFLWYDGAAAAIFSAPFLARSLPRVLETLRYGTVNFSPSGSGHAKEAELLSMAVADGFRRREVGTSLAGAFVSTATELGSESARVVVGATNFAAIKLYRGAGFDVTGSLLLHSGVESLLLRADLTQTSHP